MKLIIGRKPVLEAINSGKQVEQVNILLGQRGAIITAIRVAAKKHRIKCNVIPIDKFKKITGKPNHQGVAALKSDQKFFPLEDIINESEKKEYPLILILDSIQDTHNAGAILRSAECCGVDGIIITEHKSAPVNTTVVKTSAGATEHLKICKVHNLSQTLAILKKNGFWIVGSSLQNAVDYTEVDYKIPIALIVGNEEKGIRKLTAENCDFLVKIPIKGKIRSLNVSVAAGVLLFDILKQRKS